MVSCGFLAAWQWGRAGTAMGSAVNVGYGLQWPVFAVFFGWIWWRMLRIEIVKLREAPEPVFDEPAPAVSEPSPFAYRAPRAGTADETESPALAEYNRMLAALAAQDRELEQQEGR